MSRSPLGSKLTLGPLTISYYSLLIASAVLIGFFLASREEKRMGLEKDTVLDFILVAIPLGVIGARLYYVAFEWNYYSKHLGEIPQVWHGGLAIYGAVLGGIAAAFLTTRKKRHILPGLLDAVAPSVVLAQAIGRWGNYANMEAFGQKMTNPTLCFFPLAVEINRSGVWEWYEATFFYESSLCLMIFIALRIFRTRAKHAGDVFWWYIFLYGMERLFVEGLRSDSLMFTVLGQEIRVSQLLSALLCALSAFVFLKRNQKRFAPDMLMLLCCTLCVLSGGVSALCISCAVLGTIMAVWHAKAKHTLSALLYAAFAVLTVVLCLIEPSVQWERQVRLFKTASATLLLLPVGISAYRM